MDTGTQVRAFTLQDGEFRCDPVNVATVANDPNQGHTAVQRLWAAGEVEEDGQNVGDTRAAGDTENIRVDGEVAHCAFAVWTGEDDGESGVGHQALM